MITITHPTLYDISQSFHFFYVLVVSISCFHFVAFCIAISMLITLVITLTSLIIVAFIIYPEVKIVLSDAKF